MSTKTVSNWGSVEVLGTHHISTLPRYWMTRGYVALSILSSLYTTWFEKEALTHRLIDATGQQGWIMTALLAVVASVALIDVIVNDLCPNNVSLQSFKQYRHFIYIALAMGQVSLCYVFVSGLGWYRPLMSSFLLDASVAAMVAFVDLFQRHRVESQQ